MAENIDEFYQRLDQEKVYKFAAAQEKIRRHAVLRFNPKNKTEY